MPKTPSHSSTPATMTTRVFPKRSFSSWRFWLPALLLGILAVVVSEDIDDWLLQAHVPRVWYVLVSRTLGAAMIIIPLYLYLVWRQTAEREKYVNERLREAESLREDLTNMLVHDLKSPIVSAGMALNALRRLSNTQGERSPREKEMLQIALDNYQRLDFMVQNLLDVARTEGGQLPLTVAAANVTEVLRRAVSEVAPRAHTASIELREDYQQTPVVALVDADKLRRVVNNLLDNAIKFTPAGGYIEVAAKPDGEEALITVRDTGEGIPEDLHDRIFEKFTQAPGAQRGHRRSVGLGLTFCKLAVEAHGGRIWVENAPEGGSAFALALPLSGGKVGASGGSE